MDDAKAISVVRRILADSSDIEVRDALSVGIGCLSMRSGKDVEEAAPLRANSSSIIMDRELWLGCVEAIHLGDSTDKARQTVQDILASFDESALFEAGPEILTLLSRGIQGPNKPKTVEQLSNMLVGMSGEISSGSEIGQRFAFTMWQIMSAEASNRKRVLLSA